MKMTIQKMALVAGLFFVGVFSQRALGETDYLGNPITAQNPTAAVKTAQECANLYMRGSNGTLINRTAREFPTAFNQFATCLNQVMLNDFKKMEADYQRLIQAGYRPNSPW